MFKNQLEFNQLSESSDNSFKFDQNEKQVQKSSNEIYQNILANQYVDKNSKLAYLLQFNHDITKDVNATPLIYNPEKATHSKKVKNSLVLKSNKNIRPKTFINKIPPKKTIKHNEEMEYNWNNDNRTKGMFDPNLKTNELNLNVRSGLVKKEKEDLIKSFNQTSFDKIRKDNILNKLFQSKITD